MQTFNLVVQGESKDGKTVRSFISAEVNCDIEMSVSMMTQLIRENETFREIMQKAVVNAMFKNSIQEITQEEYDTIQAEL